MADVLQIFKIGGHVINQADRLKEFLEDLSHWPGYKLLVHGGGRLATQLCERLHITPQMIDGRRVTDADTLQVVTMAYAGWANKQIVATLQALGQDAIGLSGADGNLICAKKRQHPTIDYGYVGDICPDAVNARFLKELIDNQHLPVLCAITHDGQGQLLNTNADTIAGTVAMAMAQHYEVNLNLLFEKPGVLSNPEDDNSLIPLLNPLNYKQYKADGVITAGMIPKLDNAFAALEQGVKTVRIASADSLKNKIKPCTEISLNV